MPNLNSYLPITTKLPLFHLLAEANFFDHLSMIALTSEPIDVAAALTFLQSEQAGAIDFFLGVVRDNTQERPVDRLEYEAYDRMAISEMQKIADDAQQQWPILTLHDHSPERDLTNWRNCRVDWRCHGPPGCRF